MSWFTLALIAPLIWACVNLLDDHLLRNVYRSAMFGTAISGIFGVLPAVCIYCFAHPQTLESKFIVCAIIAGFLTAVFHYFYFKTLENEDPSVAIALNNLAPAIVPFLAFFILHEKLDLLQYIGLAIIVFGSFALSAIDIKRLRFTSAILYAIYAAAAYALISIFAKYAYQGGSFASVFIWISIGYGIGGLAALALLKDKSQIRGIFNKSQKRLMAILAGVELLDITGELVQGAAISGGPVTVVRGLEGIQPLYVLLIGIVLSRFLPRHFRERHDSRFNKKIICIIFMLAGLFMI